MKRTILYLLAVSTAAGLCGCEDFLTKEPKLSQSNEITLSDFDGLDDATFGAYYYIASTGWYGCDWVLNCEMRSGNGVKSNDEWNSGRYLTPYIWNYTEDNTSSMWAYCYYTVSAANNVLDAMSGVSADEQDLNNLKAECLFLRAFSHFCNVLTYGQPYTYQPESLGVPYVEHTDASGKPARETVKENYEKIVRDLLEAESIIDPSYRRSGTSDPLAFVNIYTIEALLSRVYLYMGEWQKCADYATKVINSGEYTMWTASDYADAWSNDKGSGEIIFEVYDKQANGTNGYWSDISYLTDPEGYADTQCSQPLLDLFEDGDVRGTMYRTDADGASGHWWTTKYAGKGDGTPDANNVVILRLSEMYLNRAEALVRGASISGVTALADMSTITSNRGASAYTSVGMEDIRTERRKELAWEGHYIYDMARWGLSVSRAAADYPLCTENLNVAFPSYRWALPIPKRELEVNENLEQNPEY